MQKPMVRVLIVLALGLGLGIGVRAWTGPGAAPPNGNPGFGWTDGGTSVYLTTSGDSVGIGTTGPGQKLDVVGHIRALGSGDKAFISSNSSAGGKALSLFAGSAESSLHYDSNGTFQIISNTKTNIQNATFAGTTRFLIDTSGNVGIATTPGVRLDVSGTIRGTDLTCTDCLNAGDIAADAIGSSELAVSGVTLGTYGNATNVPQITIDSDGRITAASNVGITGGSGSPGGANTNVQFNNAGAFGGSANFFWDNTNSRLGITGELTMGNYETGAAFDIGSIAVNYPGNNNLSWPGGFATNIVLSGLDATTISFHDSGATLGSLGHQANNFWFDGAGGWGPVSLGINTRTPAAALHVVGGARITGIPNCDTIDTNASGDLVCGTDATGAGGITGSGTTNTLPKWTGATSLGNSQVTDDGTTVRMGGLDVNGVTRFGAANVLDSWIPYGDGNVYLTAEPNIYFRRGSAGGWTTAAQITTNPPDMYVNGQRVCRKDGTGCPNVTWVGDTSASSRTWAGALCPLNYSATGGEITTGDTSGLTIREFNQYVVGSQVGWQCRIAAARVFSCYSRCIPSN